MDPVTHTLTGALIGQAGLKRRTGLAMPALIVGANLPDIDIACLLWLDGIQHLAFRRGITHGPIAWVVLPLLLAGALWWFDRWQAKRGTRPEGRLPVHFGRLYALSFIACLTHPALDWLNVYGVRLLEPFSSRWFYGDTLFIIDVWLWAIMGVGLWLSLRREMHGGAWWRPAHISLAISSLYIATNFWISHWLYATGVSDARPTAIIQSPLPIAFWDRQTIIGFDDPYLPPWIVKGDPGALPIPLRQYCRIPSDASIRRRSDVTAFLFWSRAPFAERAPDGSVLLRDARYYDPQARNRFTVALPDEECEPIHRGRSSF